MCGIAGIVNLYSDPSIDRVERMTFMMSLRGPDNHQVTKYNNCVLGHRRLSIIDLTADSNQPFEFGDSSIVFNGEIYNYKELKSELLDEGIDFTTNSDTEVIVVVYQCSYSHITSKLWEYLDHIVKLPDLIQ